MEAVLIRSATGFSNPSRKRTARSRQQLGHDNSFDNSPGIVIIRRHPVHKQRLFRLGQLPPEVPGFLPELLHHSPQVLDLLREGHLVVDAGIVADGTGPGSIPDDS